MSTRAMIYKQKPDGTLVGIYLHWDGYPDEAGRLLKEHYASEEKVDQLLALGSLSELGESMDCPEGHSYQSSVQGHCVAYHRDRGEPWASVAPVTKASMAAAMDHASCCAYVYVWTKKEGWRFATVHGGSGILGPIQD